MKDSDFNNFNFLGWWFIVIGLLSALGSLAVVGVSIWAVVKLVSWITT